jgi:tetratricopeptide (TPR) repeat protein
MTMRKMAVAVLLPGLLLFAAGCSYTPDVSRRPEMNEGQAALAACKWLRDNAGTVSIWGDPYAGLQLVAAGQATGRYSYDNGGLVINGPDVPSPCVLCTPGRAMPQCKRFLDYVYAIRYWHSAKGQAEKAAAFAQFQESARAWRALPVKPDLPQEVIRFRNVAENAFREKEFGDAANYYEQGLAIMPLWPEGWYNAAVIYAEEQCYAQAALDMKRYLELCPGAPEADAARQKMDIWEEKGKKAPVPIPEGVSRSHAVYGRPTWGEGAGVAPGGSVINFAQ